MKRIPQTLFYLAAALSAAATAYFYFSGRSPKRELAGEPVKYRSFNLDAADQAAAGDSGPGRLTAAIELGADETLLDIYLMNLDFDEEDEQILIVRRANDPRGIIRIVVADYSHGSRRWTRVWEGETLATKVRTFQVSVDDLVGDHNVSIVCFGLNDASQQTMSVFWREPAAGRLSFVKVFETAADVISVETVARPDSYKLGQTNAESWPISVWRPDELGGSNMDQIRETWRWSFQDRSYVKAAQERIPGASIAKRLADAVLDGNPSTFEGWLDGIWYKESTDPLSPQALFLTFQPRDTSLLFSGQGVVEVYQWEASNATRFGIYISARNQVVRNVRRLLDIELAAADLIHVRVFQDLKVKADISGRWDGRYRRMSADTARAFRRPPSAAASASLDLDGLYVAADGTTLTLAGSSYSWTREDGLEQGGFSSFKLQGVDVLDLRALSADGQPSSARTSWIVRLDSRSEDGGAPIRVLRLQPARVRIDGVGREDGPELVLEKRDD